MTLFRLRLLFAFAALLAAAAPARAQDVRSPYGTRVVVEPGSKGAALLAALRFSSALAADSVRVAACRVAEALGDDYRAVVRPALGSRLVEPALVPGQPARCEARALQENDRALVFVDQLVQLRRESSGVLSYLESVEFEVRLEVVVRPGYREWHQVLVRPAEIGHAQGGVIRVTSWRVMRYEVAGWEYSDSRR